MIRFELQVICDDWKGPVWLRFLSEFRLTIVDLDGCMFNLRSRKSDSEGVPLRKHWRVATNSQHIANELGLRCSKHHEHVRICGADTKVTEGYTPEFAEAVHRAILREAINLKQSAVSIPVACCTIDCSRIYIWIKSRP